MKERDLLLFLGLGAVGAIIYYLATQKSAPAPAPASSVMLPISGAAGGGSWDSTPAVGSTPAVNLSLSVPGSAASYGL